MLKIQLLLLFYSKEIMTMDYIIERLNPSKNISNQVENRNCWYGTNGFSKKIFLLIIICPSLTIRRNRSKKCDWQQQQQS